jgi:hypothetical protein
MNKPLYAWRVGLVAGCFFWIEGIIDFISLLFGELMIMEISHFVRNDNQWFKFRRGCWLAALPPTNILSIQKNE